MRAWLYCHSLSVALAAGAIVCSVLGYRASTDENNFAYDFWLMAAGGFLGSFILVVLARHLWEKDSDPATPPKKR